MNKMATPFEQAYTKLNKNQRLAVDTLDGPVLVLAGPGTGKTQVLTTRVANILQNTDTEPGSILALTFTEAAAKEMKRRLVNLIGEAGFYVKICTFHSFCSDILQENPERFSRSRSLQTLTDLEKIQIIQNILEQNTFHLLKPVNDPLFYLNPIISNISNLKREGFTPEKFSELVTLLSEEFEIEKESLKKTTLLEKQKLVQKNQDLLQIYQQYQKQISATGKFDFDDMVNWVVESFESDSDFLLGYQEKYQYLLVDEYQDTNSAQNRLIFSLANYWGESANLFCVGDPNQSIMRFQGASKENILEFNQKYPRATRIVLDQNYRSTKLVLDATASLLGEVPLNSNTNIISHPIKAISFSEPIFEDYFLVKSIKSKIKNGANPKDIAVIAKENKDIEVLIPLFKQFSLPYRLEAGTNILSTPIVSQFIKLLRVVTNLQGPVDDLELFTVFGYSFFHIDSLSLLKAARVAYNHKKTFVDTLFDDNPDIDDSIVSLFHQFLSWNTKISTSTTPQIFQTIFQESGLLNYLLSSPNSLVELSRFNTLFDEVKTQSTTFPELNLFDFVRNLTLMEENQIKLPEPNLLGDENAVTLTTAHKSKGLEWKIVYIYRFADTHWGNKQTREMIKLPPGIIVFEKPNEEDKNAEERRLFYVALTRSKQQIYLLGSREYEHSSKMTYPSVFLSQIPKEFIKKINIKYSSTYLKKILQTNLTPTQATVLNHESSYLIQLLKDLKLSPTSLNTYLDCHYKFKLDHLYRLPRTKTPSLCFGTAVHSALEYLYTELKNSQKIITEAEFIHAFEAALSREILTPKDEKDRLIHGKKVLSAYYQHHLQEFKTPLYTEKNFGSSNSIPFAGIFLSGKSDRIDLIDANKKQVRFIDYKTGKPKTRGEIEGTTQNSDGGYKRQLVFYKLLAELDQSFPYQVSEAKLDFVEPDAKGDFRSETFIISDSEVEDLKKTISESVDGIKQLNFDRTKDTSKCPKCPFFSHCWPSGLSK